MGTSVNTEQVISEQPHRADPRAVRLIHRDEIPEIRSVVVNGEQHNLGILKDFRRHPELQDFIPDPARLSMSWVHLDPGEVLNTHVHPTPSMIVVAHGEGQVDGDLEAALTTGDIVAIPAGCYHGFRGAGTHGLWALSIQFEGLGLYEDAGNARVRFTEQGSGADAHPGFYELLARNERFSRDFLENNPVNKILTSELLTDTELKRRFFNALHVFSAYFQRALFARSAAADEPRYAEMFREHLAEEYGHDQKLVKDLGAELSPVWDPTLEAASNWFVWKMLTLDNTDKVVLMSLVLEVSSHVFSKHALAVIPGVLQTDYFEIHAIADVQHQEAGLPLLKHLDDTTYERLFKVQQEGWDMLNLMASRVGGFADGN
jgi:quercetin dioxygenase-like cupin family protein